MKKLMTLLILTFSLKSFATQYNCTLQGNMHSAFESINLEVISPDKIIINENDIGNKDDFYRPSYFYRHYSKFTGDFKTIGDGTEGYSVYLVLSNKLLKNKTLGTLQYRASGPDGYYSNDYKCEMI